MTKMDPMLAKALKIIEEKGWSSFSLADLTNEEEVTLAKIHAKYPSRMCLIEEFSRCIDQITLENLDKFNGDESARDKLFSVIMTRFDALEPYKKSVKTIMQDSWKDPLLIIGSIPLGMNSISWLLQAGDLDTTGLQGLFRIKVFSFFYLRIICSWTEDNSESLDKTMIYLDNNLNTLSQIPGFF